MASETLATSAGPQPFEAALKELNQTKQWPPTFTSDRGIDGLQHNVYVFVLVTSA